MMAFRRIVNRIFHSKKKIDYGDGVYPPEGFTGIWEVYWPNAQMKYKCDFRNGHEEGTHTCFWDNGQVAQVGTMLRGKCIGRWSDYAPEGHKQLEGEYGENGKTGIWFSYWPDGTVMMEVSYENGEEHGLCRHFNAHGQLEFEGEFREGQPFSGICEVFAYDKQPDGSYHIRSEYENGEQLRQLD